MSHATEGERERERERAGERERERGGDVDKSVPVSSPSRLLPALLLRLGACFSCVIIRLVVQLRECAECWTQWVGMRGRYTNRERERVGRERRAFGIREAAAETRVGGPRARGGVEVKTQGSVRVGKI